MDRDVQRTRQRTVRWLNCSQAVSSAKPFQAFASSVSGGSVGLISYLREYTGPKPFHSVNGAEDIRERMTSAANCSSLEAVAWGLEYNDFANLLFTGFPYPSSGSDLRDGAPIGRDRTWALEQAFNRNQTDEHCGTTNNLEV